MEADLPRPCKRCDLAQYAKRDVGRTAGNALSLVVSHKPGQRIVNKSAPQAAVLPGKLDNLTVLNCR